ncbi:MULTISPECIES: hypothetical protein [Streptococcus]|uniref:Uncharacterized protein n=3 Tax=Streptococcus TaxID=1301 RepID=A0AAE4TP65_STRCB|nr:MULTISPECIES: hypothetical protein [Streptococcus]MCY7208839.1 hypothetical protein [Streptococcus dysgalactiae]MDV5976590.1 hypothetical protein [Streptococcus canis]OBY99823.1 hypothetical protein BBG01_01290 [Streptococcus dysgalactiae subsp. equisimilis]OCX02586.1 hypothetical protein BBG10_04360 [Streptococcus dysgalactiae subsp. equisimilis]OCX04138.1 hypothetical protein BBG08_01210 [Streptococcus dysgalactiae subsp. equisimilis]
MSNQLKNLINALQGNMEVVGEFFDNPSLVIENYGITGMEKEALLTRDLNALDKIALSIKQKALSPSGAHSSGCHIIDPE